MAAVQPVHNIVARNLEHELREVIRGDLRFDQMSRQLYSTDASSYRVLPTGAVMPCDADDVSAIMKAVKSHDLSVVPRGGGTSLSGQTIGPGIVLDHSRYMDQIIELNTEAKWVWVGSGMVLDQLNRALRPHGLMVGPDPASSAAATLGGMTGNNSTGSHSIKYGMVADHVREVDVVLSDGAIVRFGPRTPEEVRALSELRTLEGRLYRDIPRLIAEYQTEIAENYPKTWRSVAGYNLPRVARQIAAGGSLNLAPLILGSEGTLGVITAVKIGLVERPRHNALLILHFDDLRAALESVPLILTHKPSAVELVDRYFNQLTKQSPEYAPLLKTFIEGDPRAVLIVEFDDGEPPELAHRAERLQAELRTHGHRGLMLFRDQPKDIAAIWATRKAGLGLLQSMRGDAKPLAFVDDAAVPVESLADYALEVERACTDSGTTASFYAHASAGCLHINPLINLKSPRGLEQMQKISQAVAEIAISYGGTTTGEHGEGYARSYYNEKLFGPRLHKAFRQLKALYDPENRLNPGKIIDGTEPWDPEVLRISPGYSADLAPNITFFDYSQDGGFAGLVEMCNGQGVCRKRDTGVMCPSFMATRDEAHSTRGRANALRAAMTGQLGPDGMVSEELHDVLDLCLACKACKRECPSLVDMAKLKFEFLAGYQAAHGTPLRSRLFGLINRVNWLGSVLPGFTNWMLRNPRFKQFMDTRFGVDQRRSLPTLASTTFRDWFRMRRDAQPGTRGRVALWDDTFTQYNEPEIGQAAVKVLEAAGYSIELVKNRRCCGRPMISKGLLKEAKQNAAHNVMALLPYAQNGVPVLGLEPSCVSTLRDEYPDFLRGERGWRDASQMVAENSYFIEEYIAGLAARGELKLDFPKDRPPRKYYVHGHCHQKALIGTADMIAMLRLIPNADIIEIESGCCGMAGSFGYEKEHYEVSMACGEDRLFPAVRGAERTAVIVAPGTSCRHQIADGTYRSAVHPIVALAEALG